MCLPGHQRISSQAKSLLEKTIDKFSASNNEFQEAALQYPQEVLVTGEILQYTPDFLARFANFIPLVELQFHNAIKLIVSKYM